MVDGPIIGEECEDYHKGCARIPEKGLIDMSNSARALRGLVVVLLIILSCAYLYDNFPWMWRVVLSEIIGRNFASGYYVFELNNSTDEPLIIEVTNLNDRNWELRSVRDKYIQERLGRIYTQELCLHPAEKELIILPSYKHGGMGLIAVVARTDWSILPLLPNQHVAAFVVPSHMTSGVHPDYRSTDDTYPSITIEYTDLQPLSPESVSQLNKVNVDLVPEQLD